MFFVLLNRYDDLVYFKTMYTAVQAMVHIIAYITVPIKCSHVE